MAIQTSIMLVPSRLVSEPPSELVTGTFSDWASQDPNVGHQVFGTAGLDDRLRDLFDGVRKWGGAFRPHHLAVVEAPAGRDLLFANCMEVVHQDWEHSGTADMTNFALTNPAVGDTYNFGWTMSVDMPNDAGAENGAHGFRHGSPRNWEFLSPFIFADNIHWTHWWWLPGNTQVEWGIWTNGADEGGGSNHHTGGPLLLKDHFYEIQVQMEILSDTTCHFRPYIFDAEANPRVLVYDYTDYFNDSLEYSSVALSSEPTIGISRTAFSSESRMGSNGGLGSNDWTFPLPHYRMAAFRYVIGQQIEFGTPIGPYGSVTDGVHTEGE